MSTDLTERSMDLIEPGTARRSFLGRISMGILATFAASAAGAPPAGATHPKGCCIPGSSTYCGGSSHPYSFTCRSGHYKRFWYCCYQGWQYKCGECTAQASCWDGPWSCSWRGYAGQQC